jgi:hypothetical protein
VKITSGVWVVLMVALPGARITNVCLSTTPTRSAAFQIGGPMHPPLQTMAVSANVPTRSAGLADVISMAIGMLHERELALSAAA